MFTGKSILHVENPFSVATTLQCGRGAKAARTTPCQPTSLQSFESLRSTWQNPLNLWQPGWLKQFWTKTGWGHMSSNNFAGVTAQFLAGLVCFFNSLQRTRAMKKLHSQNLCAEILVANKMNYRYYGLTPLTCFSVRKLGTSLVGGQKAFSKQRMSIPNSCSFWQVILAI